MAINDISLTAGMRSNLTTLQGTAALLDRTQNRLSTGKKVNTALDNPTAFFAAQSLNSRASIIEGLKDQMGQAIQTVQAADKGIKALTSLIEQAKGVAQQAASATASTGFDSETVTLNSVANGDTITIGGQTLTAGPTAVVTTVGTISMDLSANTIDDTETLIIGGATFTAVATTASTVTYNSYSVDFNVGAIAAGDTVTVGGVTYTATNGATAVATEFDISGTPDLDATALKAKVDAHQAGAFNIADNSFGVLTITSGTSTLGAGSVSTDSTIDIGSNTTTTYDAVGPGEFLIGATGTATANNLANAITDLLGGAYTVSSGSGTVTLTDGTSSVDDGSGTGTGIADDGTAGADVAISTVTTTSAGALAADEFAVTGNDVIDAEALKDLINNTAAITTLGYAATASNGVLTLTNSATDIGNTLGNDDVTVSDAATMVEASVTADTELDSLQNQYNSILTQLNELAGDSGYKGKNLLAGATLTVKFEGNSLDVVGFKAMSADNDDPGDLAITAATWTTGGDIDTDIDALDSSLETLRQKASSFSANLSIITTRQEFSTDMVNTLTEGANKLTLADTNEEGANMLMLQTRQSLGTTALSLSAQAAQSVLRLFG